MYVYFDALALWYWYCSIIAAKYSISAKEIV